LDSQAVHLIANYGRMKAQALNTEFIQFQPTEFASKLVRPKGAGVLFILASRLGPLGEHIL